MALSRNQRRLKAKVRKALALCDKANNTAILERKAVVRANLGRNPARDCSNGLVTNYGLITRPIGRRERAYSKGAANMGTSGGQPV